MAATIITIADALETALNVPARFSAPFDAALGATREYHCRFTLEELATLHVTILTPAASWDLSARTVVEGDLVLAVIVQKRTDGTKTAADALMLLVHEMALYLADLDLGDAHAVSVEFDPLYDADLLRDERTFTSVMLVTFKQGVSLS